MVVDAFGISTHAKLALAGICGIVVFQAKSCVATLKIAESVPADQDYTFHVQIFRELIALYEFIEYSDSRSTTRQSLSTTLFSRYSLCLVSSEDFREIENQFDRRHWKKIGRLP